MDRFGREINVDKADLVKKIKSNLSSHRITYEAAVKEFERRTLELLRRQLEAAERGGEFDRFALSRMPVPEDHTDDYKRTLRMLEMETRDEVSVTENEFRRYVDDEWEWSRSWTENTVGYTVTR